MGALIHDRQLSLNCWASDSTSLAKRQVRLAGRHIMPRMKSAATGRILGNSANKFPGRFLTDGTILSEAASRAFHPMQPNRRNPI